MSLLSKLKDPKFSQGLKILVLLKRARKNDLKEMREYANKISEVTREHGAIKNIRASASLKKNYQLDEL